MSDTTILLVVLVAGIFNGLISYIIFKVTDRAPPFCPTERPNNFSTAARAGKTKNQNKGAWPQAQNKAYEKTSNSLLWHRQLNNLLN